MANAQCPMPLSPAVTGRTLHGGISALCALVALAAGRALADAPEPPSSQPAAQSVLDWRCSYWRCHLTYRRPRYSEPFKDLRGRMHTLVSYERGWHVAPMAGRIECPAPPADWFRPDFDDGLWPRGRRPEAGSEGWSYDPIVQVKRLRGRFEISDPARASSLTLHLEYVGGVVAWLNGRELARGHMPPGPPTADILAEGYPLEAYEEPGAKWMMGHEGNVERPPTAKALAIRYRRLDLTVDPKLLVRGVNVLAVSVHQSGYHPAAAKWSWSCGGMGGNTSTWPHMQVRSLRLEAQPADSAAKPARPETVAVWAEDIHRRVVNRDLAEPGTAPPVIRIVGARNGTFSGQVVVGTAGPLSGLSATMGGLRQVGGAGTIPADAVQVRYPAAMPLIHMSVRRSESHLRQLDPAADRMLTRYAFGTGWQLTRKERAGLTRELTAEAEAIMTFDGLADDPPRTIPADTCQPVWVTVQVPPDAPAGDYRGTLTVHAGRPHNVEVRVMVMDWALPDGRDFASFVGLQHSLWGSCRQYKADPWSERHWQLLDQTLRLLAEVGNDIIVLPLVCGGEAGNEESLVPLVVRGDGWEYDWKNADRYLDLVAGRLGRNVAVVAEICWAPPGGPSGWQLKHPAVTAVEAGRAGPKPLPAPDSPEWSRTFVPFARAVRDHLRHKGFANLHWGWFYDSPQPVAVLAETLAEALPDVGWARASHNGNTNVPFPKTSKARVTLDMHIRGFPQSFDRDGEPLSRRGWEKPDNILFPRVASQIQAIGRFESPMGLRWLTENCLVNGSAGFGRLGADFWPPFSFASWYHPFVNYLLWPGPEGPCTTIRFEGLREGVQEAEVRIRLEKAGKDKDEPARSVLGERIRLMGAVPSGPDNTLVGEYYGGWQERSWDLYGAAAAAFGGKAPSAEDRNRFFSPPSRP